MSTLKDSRFSLKYSVHLQHLLSPAGKPRLVLTLHHAALEDKQEAKGDVIVAVVVVLWAGTVRKNSTGAVRPLS